MACIYEFLNAVRAACWAVSLHLGLITAAIFKEQCKSRSVSLCKNVRILCLS
jgi:hypothetical protein